MSKLVSITRRSGISVIKNSNKILSAVQWSSVLDNISNDIKDVVTELGKVKSIMDGLAKGSDDEIIGLASTYDAILNGLDGTVEFTKRNSTTNDPDYIFSKTLNRPLTIKESIETVFSSLATEIDNKLKGIAVSPTDISSILLYTGMLNSSDDSPTYSSYGTISTVEDGDPLTEAIQKIDEEIASLLSDALPNFTVNSILFGDGTNIPIIDSSNLYWNNTSKRLGIGNAAPTTSLDVTGTISMSTGILSTGGDARGTSATDLQTIRSTSTQVASGAYSSILGGRNNTASGSDSIACGRNNNVSGVSSIGIGRENTVSSNQSHAIGTSNIVNGSNSIAIGNNNSILVQNATVVGRYGSGKRSGSLTLSDTNFASVGDAQTEFLTIKGISTGATVTDITVDGINSFLMENDSSYLIKVFVVGRDTTSNESAAYELVCLAKRNANEATSTIVGSVSKNVRAEDAAAWDANLTVNTVTGSIILTVNGGLGSGTIYWVTTWIVTDVTG